ncbi:MAG: sulfatase-like hydrolase/transferase [Candidatus Krumholzibacteriota bacterium]|nr:sulfatase-like hydrolase/transferase [Candidatus Krumholzibacteriota bacterium]
MKVENENNRTWVAGIFLTVLCAYFFISMEWLFFVTKQSFMSTMGVLDRLRVLWISPLPLIAAAAAILLLFWIPSALIGNKVLRKIFLILGTLIPTLILTCSVFLLIDNFTYTVFRFGVKSTVKYQGLVYGLLILILGGNLFLYLNGLRAKLIRPAVHSKLRLIASGLVLISLVFAFASFDYSRLTGSGAGEDGGTAEKRPNIILLASDGLNAENMSLYGYFRDTTPYLKALSANALLCENCFTNAGSSGGSISSMFTGKLPTQTKMIYPPDILKGEDAYLHLPGLLKKVGYRNMDISITHYADPFDMNLRESFDWANYREAAEPASYLSRHLSFLIGQESDYLLYRVRERLTGRLLHAFGVRLMRDSYSEVTKGEKPKKFKAGKYKASSRHITGFFTFIDESPAPFFAHLHLLGTHGPRFSPAKQVFSQGVTQHKTWMMEYYDDAVLNFDGQVQEIVRGLQQRRILDNTIIVINTDHGKGFTVHNRIPLMFIFPRGEYRGRIRANVQNLDIGPTLLDYMGMEQPEWMGGQSLISSPPDSTRHIFTVDRKHGIEVRTSKGLVLDGNKIGPPFYSLGSVGVFYRHKFFNLKLNKSMLIVSDIKGHTWPCTEDEIPDARQVERLLLDHLAANGYDISSLKTPLTIKEYSHESLEGGLNEGSEEND